MTQAAVTRLRDAITADERADRRLASLFDHLREFNRAPKGISVIVPIFNGGTEMRALFISLAAQSLPKSRYEVIFALNGCTDDTAARVQAFAETSGVATRILTLPEANVGRARNAALQAVRFRYATFVDHDDHLSRHYLQECVELSGYRTVLVSNIARLENGVVSEDYAQKVIARGFVDAQVFAAGDIGLCYRAYTLNAIKTAPSYMLRRVAYAEDMTHSEDVKYWRDLFHAFRPITMKSPTLRDTYYRCIVPASLSRRDESFFAKARPRLAILQAIEADAARYACDAPQRKFDAALQQLLLDTLRNLGV